MFLQNLHPRQLQSNRPQTINTTNRSSAACAALHLILQIRNRCTKLKDYMSCNQVGPNFPLNLLMKCLCTQTPPPILICTPFKDSALSAGTDLALSDSTPSPMLGPIVNI